MLASERNLWLFPSSVKSYGSSESSAVVESISLDRRECFLWAVSIHKSITSVYYYSIYFKQSIFLSISLSQTWYFSGFGSLGSESYPSHHLQEAASFYSSPESRQATYKSACGFSRYLNFKLFILQYYLFEVGKLHKLQSSLCISQLNGFTHAGFSMGCGQPDHSL